MRVICVCGSVCLFVLFAFSVVARLASSLNALHRSFHRANLLSGVRWALFVLFVPSSTLLSYAQLSGAGTVVRTMKTIGDAQGWNAAGAAQLILTAQVSLAAPLFSAKYLRSTAILTQVIGSESLTSQSPRALIQRAIDQMGGSAAWIAAGGAQAEIVTVIGTQELHGTWIDQWGSGEYRFARHNASGSRVVDFRSTDKKQKSLLPSSSRNSELAEIYPAMALVLALQSESCTFSLPTQVAAQSTPNPTDEDEVIQECQIPGHSSQILEWRLSQAGGLPTSVSVPLATVSSPATIRKKIEFSEYKNFGYLISPSLLKVTLPGGASYSQRVTSMHIGASVPDSGNAGGAQ